MKISKIIKTTASIFVFMVIGLEVMSFTTSPINQNTEINSSWYTSSTDKLYNSEYDMTLTLYSNGYATLKSANGPASGNYTIDNNNKIIINWDDHESEYGYVTSVSTTSGRRIKSAVVHGVTFTNQERFVISR